MGFVHFFVAQLAVRYTVSQCVSQRLRASGDALPTVDIEQPHVFEQLRTSSFQFGQHALGRNLICHNDGHIAQDRREEANGLPSIARSEAMGPRLRGDDVWKRRTTASNIGGEQT